MPKITLESLDLLENAHRPSFIIVHQYIDKSVALVLRILCPYVHKNKQIIIILLLF